MKRLLHLLFFIFFTQFLNAQCDASFHVVPIGCSNDTVSFVFDGQNSTDSFFWDFGDSLSSQNSDTVENPSHLFSDTGIFNVRLIVKDTGNCIDTQYLSVAYYPKVKANFSVISGLCIGDTTFFKNESYPSNITSRWSFNDVFSGLNNTSVLTNPKHKFTFSGAYQVKLKITDISNCSDSITKTIQIYTLPKASFSVSNVCKNLSAVFKSTSIIDPLDSIEKAYWNTGDNFEDSILMLTHNYSDTGLFTIKFKLKTYAGCSDSAVQTVRIYEAPRFTISKDSACRNANVLFTNIANTYTPVSYLWNFGDSTTSNFSSPIHQFKTAGNFKINLTHIFTGNFQCTSKFDSVFIFTPPVADFTINNDSQCYNGNSVCVNFEQNSKISYRRISFDDGFVDDFTPLSDTQICYSYNNIAGGSYFITAELLDSNQCSNNFTFTTPVIIYPQLKVEYTQNTDNGCFKTNVVFQNISNQNPPQITKFKWDFGDGNTDSVNWSSSPHTYTNDGQFSTKLTATNSSGCTDSFEITNGIINTNFIVDAHLDSSSGSCRTNNRFYFKQTPIIGGSISWHFASILDSFTNNYSPIVSYGTQGKYFPYVRVYKDGCDSFLFLDTIIISGPTAAISSVINSFQCEIMDTVTFHNSSFFYANQSASFLWNFGDINAPSCTTDTKNGINLYMNCNYSKDSIPVKHWYSPGFENCYYISLNVYDTILGCSDQQSTSIALQKPIASPQTNAVPAILGLLLSKQQICLGPEVSKTIYPNLGFTQPSCNRQFYWVMWDSTCAAQSGNFDSKWEALAGAHNYAYSGTNKPCSPDGKVTIGLIIQNGNDSTGNICRDTAWYHDILSFLFMDPAITSSYNANTYYCPNTTFSFSVKDSIQDSITKVRWDWGDGNIETDLNLNTRTHTYKKSGTYRVKFYVENIRGCFGEDTSILITLGLNTSAFLSRNKLCVNDTAHLHKYINYFNDNKNYWEDPVRAAQGKEYVLWDFDDGNGYVDSFSNYLKYTNAGNHLIKLIAVDSLGCQDTIQLYDTLHISGVFTSFNIQEDTAVCAQLVPFQNTSTLYDSVSNFAQTDDTLIKYFWTFNPLLNTSSLQNPNIFLKPNTYQIQLKTESKYGCIDSFSRALTILGPSAKYEIISDSFGCQPSLMVLKNTSINANNYIWQFNDANKNAVITDQDTNISFSYTDFGKFYPTLIAQGNFVKNGIPFTCSSTFPDTTTVGFREITIYEKPKSDFYYKTDCSINTTQFYDSSKITNGNIVSYFWDFGDGDTSTQKNPVHVYSDTGKFYVFLRTFSDKNCADSIIKLIVIAPVPDAKFTASNTCVGQTTNFTDLSLGFNDNIYLWEWHLDDTISSDQHPTKFFPIDTSYIVSLKVTNIAGCSDSISDTIKIHSIPKSLFSFTNGCDIDSIEFLNESYSKELPLTYHWNFGVNISDTAKNPSKKYEIDGDFEVKLIVTSPFSCSDSLSKHIQIYPSPKAKYTVDNDKQCFDGNQFSFADSGYIPTGNYTVKWFFGDGDSSDLQNISHAYKDTGLYYVQLIATSDFSCIDTITDSVRVFPSPTADFDINNTQQCLLNNTFIFTDKSNISEGNYQIDWLFDNQLEHDSIVNYQFNDTGFYDVKLKISSNFSCADSIVKSMRILPMPFAEFTIDDSAQCFSNHQFNITNNSQISWGNLSDKWNFGDNDTSILFSPSHIYNSVDTFEVTLISTSQANCRDTFSRNLIVFPMPVARFSINDSGQCLTGNLFEFTDSSNITYGNLSYNWDFADATFDTAKNPIKTYQNFGNFNIKLIATSNQNCNDTASDSVYVYPMPIAKIIIDDTTSCLKGNEFNFTDNSNIAYGNIHTFWNFGDNKSDINSITQHSYINYGKFNIKLISTSDENCKDSTQQIIQIYAQPNAKFSINDSIQCLVGNHFIFTNNSNINTGAFTSHWDFGDNDTALAFSTSHDYQNFGDFNTQLIVSSNENCLDTFEKNIRINPNPVSKISVNDSLQCYRDNLFKMIDKTGIDEGNFNSFWTLGNGNSDTNKIFDYSYNSYGKYTLKLISTSDKNCTDSTENSIEVYAQPKADFDINDTIQCLVANHFIFTDKSSIDEGTYISNWDFGDGDTSTQKSTNHDYQNFGDFKVRLIVTSDKFCFDTIEKNNRINPNPFTKISVNDSTQCENQQSFLWIDSSSIDEGTITRKWFLGDGDTSTQKSFTKNYKTHNSYVIKLIETSDNLCTDSAYQNIIVYPQPHTKFTVNDTDQCLNINQFNFNNKTKIDYGTLSYEWNFGDGNFDTSTHPKHFYKMDDTLLVTLISTSNFQCTDTSTQEIIVFPIPETQFNINQKNQCVNTNFYSYDANATKIKYGKLTNFWWDLGNFHIQSGKLDTTNVYDYYDSLDIRFIALSEFGCFDTAYDSIIVYPKPKADYVINDAEQCVNEQNFVFTNTSNITYGSLKHYWNLGDGDSSILISPTKMYGNHDTFYVKLYAESDKQCWDTIQKRIVVFPKPNPAFMVNDSGQCLNAQLFEFTNKSTIDYGILKYRWTYGDGDSTTNQNPKHVYTYDDTFDVKMVAISNQLCKDSITKQVIVYPKPTPDFTVNDPGQCINTQQFVFTNQSNITSGNLSYKWTFGDGGKDNQTDVTHHYIKNGIYNVKLINTSGFLCVDSITKPVQVFAKPRALFTINDSEQCVNDQRFLYTSNSTIVEGKINKHHWDFQNGFTGNASPIIATFTDPGYYKVILIEESDSNCFDTVSHTTRVFPKPNSQIAYNDSAQCISGNLYLFHSLSTDSSGLKRFDWNIHNLKNSSDSAIQYRFKDTGFKNIQLIVNSNYNCWDTSLRQVYVKHMPDPTFTDLKDYYCNNESSFQLIPVTSGGTFYGQNIFGDFYDPIILFNDTVEYYVTVNGCEDSSMQTTQVFPFPEIDLGAYDTVLCKREYLELDASFWKSSYLWQNGYTSPNYRIVNEGKYKVEVTNICGTSSDSIYVSFNSENCHLYIPNAFTPTGDELNDRYKPIAYDVEFMEYYIYNRWGELLYKGNKDDNGWNATFNGSPVQIDVYMVVVNYRYFAGKLLISETESGTITLLK